MHLIGGVLVFAYLCAGVLWAYLNLMQDVPDIKPIGHYLWLVITWPFQPI